MGRVTVLALALVCGGAAWAKAGTVSTAADRVLAQPNLTSNVLNQPTVKSLFLPSDVTRDGTVGNTRFFVADTFNSRVLGLECAGSNCVLPGFATASKVFGQPDFASYASNGAGVTATSLAFPRGVAVDASGRLFVADTDNNRVLVYNGPWSDATADLVIGQTSLTANGAGSTLAKLRAPEGVHVDGSGALWVADTGNNRVLKFTSIATGATAALAIGGSGAASAATMSAPRGVVTDSSGWLYVADTGFSRVLGFTAPVANGDSADVVFGHGGSFTNGNANQGGVSAASLALPEKVATDGSGRLWIADTGNQRVLEVDSPHASGSADRVYGQVDASQNAVFTTNVANAPDGFVNAAGLDGPRGLVLDGNGTLWVCDREQSRILAFDSPLAAGTAPRVADRALGKQLFVDASANEPSATRMNNPNGVAVDTSVTPNRLWVNDLGNNRVLGFDDTASLANGDAATAVLGQSNFSSGATNAGINPALQNASTAVASASSFFFPEGVAVDGFGTVYVADTSNSRVVAFEDPFSDTTADQVFGQGDFTARNPSFPYGTASSLVAPQGVALGPTNDLWVADTLDHRVVRFSNAPSQPATSASADLVLGQSGFVSSVSFPPYTSGCAANRMNAPEGVTLGPSGRLYVADTQNHRVLVFAPPFASGMNADAVLGQANLTSCAANRGGAAGASTLASPRGVLEDELRNLYVADYGNNRALVFHAPFDGGDTTADEVIGQASFTATGVVPPTASTLFSPEAVALDGDGRLFIADRENSRVTRYATSNGGAVILDTPAAPVVVGTLLTLTGTGFSPGSVIKVFVATASGPVAFGPFTPATQEPGRLTWTVDPSIPLGNGFVAIQVINTDQGFLSSNLVSALLYGSAGLNIPTVTAVNGVALAPADPSIATANVETTVAQGSTVTLTGTGFSNALVNLFTATGNAGPLTPLGGASATQLQVVIPNGTPTGPGSIQVVNSPYTGNVKSNAVSVPIGPAISISSVSAAGSLVTVNGAGFSVLTVINLFNATPGGVVNLGGLLGNGSGVIPLTFVSESQFEFTIPGGATPGPAYVQALNPPFIPFSSTGNDPDGAFTVPP
ncbi:MAG: hypothetical protein IPK07_13460 [Deltaproteobacteria bacterium]|nr:hypothetical protein [Deltaproteobacteria bacterium]